MACISAAHPAGSRTPRVRRQVHGGGRANGSAGVQVSGEMA